MARQNAAVDNDNTPTDNPTTDEELRWDAPFMIKFLC